VACSSALDALAREELGLNPDDLGSPWGAAVYSFLAFSVGAIVPLVPFVLGLPLERAVTIAALTAGVALFGVGAALSLFTGRSATAGGLRMVLIGGGAGVATWLIGSLLGAAIQ
jgi:vacuolar iron transporter family protein